MFSCTAVTFSPWKPTSVHLCNPPLDLNLRNEPGRTTECVIESGALSVFSTPRGPERKDNCCEVDEGLVAGIVPEGMGGGNPGWSLQQRSRA